MRRILRETWLSRKTWPKAFDLSLGLLALFLLFDFLYLNHLFNMDHFLDASPDLVFQHHDYWRAWSTLFVHADLAHLLSNCILFFPFAYFLLSYYPVWFLLSGFLVGGLVNLVVLKTIPSETTLLGVSGVIYWMGAAWLTLYFKIEKRDSWRRRFGKVALVTTGIFLPETIRPEVSYLSHYLGFAFGVLSALLFYRLYRTKIIAAEKVEWQIIQDEIGEEWVVDAKEQQSNSAANLP